MAIEKIRGIVLGVVKHNDRNNVVMLFTRSRGRMALISPAGGGKSGRARNSRLMPLSVIESDVAVRENAKLNTLRSPQSVVVWRDIYFNPVKSAVAMFITEFLGRYLHDSMPDELLFDFIMESLKNLDDRKNGSANFHLSFLISFLDYAGVRPDLSGFEEGDWFDMRAGTIVAERPSHGNYLTPAQTHHLPVLMRMNRSNDSLFRFSRDERRQILRILLNYYAIHFPGMAGLHSPDVLAELFG